MFTFFYFIFSISSAAYSTFFSTIRDLAFSRVAVAYFVSRFRPWTLSIIWKKRLKTSSEGLP
jgi:hypothetical protein